MKREEVEKMFRTYGVEKEAGVTMLISQKIDFKTKTLIKDKDRHYIMIKGSLQQQHITFVNIHVPNIKSINIANRRIYVHV